MKKLSKKTKKIINNKDFYDALSAAIGLEKLHTKFDISEKLMLDIAKSGDVADDLSVKAVISSMATDYMGSMDDWNNAKFEYDLDFSFNNN